jgi:hypothetical protein
VSEPSTTPAAATASNAPADAPPSDATKSAAAPPAWSDDDDTKLFELTQRSPYKARIKGEEKAIRSRDDFREMLNHAQRGIGASKVVEASKREVAEAKKLREEASAERALIARAKAGDFEARRQLGLASEDEVTKRKQEWEAVPKEVRALFEERNKFAAELETMRAEAAERQRAEKEKVEAQHMAEARRTAIEATTQVAKALGISEKNAERYMPHVAGAIADLSEAGLEIGVDMTPELIVERVKERLGGLDEEHFGSLASEKAAAIFLAKAKGLSDPDLAKLIPRDLQVRISRMVAREYKAKREQPTAPVTRGEPVKSNQERSVPQVLSPFRWR